MTPSVDSGLNPPELFTSAGAQQALHPLRRTADRVTRQIEEFAEKLDRFKQKETRPHEFESFQAAYQLVQTYRDLTRNAMNDLSKQRALKRAKLGWSMSQNAKAASPDPVSIQIEDELARLQLEEETWELLLNLISVDDPHTRARSTAAQKTAFQKLHRYSSDRQIWEQFLDADHYALQCTIMLKWLEDTAKYGVQEVNSLIEDLGTQAERGKGVWSHGWLYTKESIKGQKRLRAWPQPLEPNGPGIAASLVNSETKDPLVTHLDPDAVTRQKQSLQKEDKFYERATWATCWKMLRQGESWTKIREWSQERMENWRAASLCGSSVDASFCGEVKSPVDDSTARMMNFRLQNSWRASCSALARNQNVDDFQRAVYGLLCGDSQSAVSACRSWDDYVYVHLNNVLISRYQGFCRQLQRKITNSPAVPVAFIPEPMGFDDLLQYLRQLTTSESVGAEARNPYRTMQAAIMSKAYDRFFHASAKTVSRAAAASPDRSSLVPDLSPYQVDESIVMAANDEDALRIASHLYVIVRSMGYTRMDTQAFGMASVNVVGYIAALEEAGVYDPIPLYASLLPADLRHSVLGKIMIGIVDRRERKQQVKLMAKHGIDIEAVLEDQWEWVWHNVSAVEHPRTLRRYAKVFTAPGGSRELASIKKDYIGTDISFYDEQIIRSLEWLRYIDGQWGKICHLGALSYRRFFSKLLGFGGAESSLLILLQSAASSPQLES
jgi:nuclear pore complex protein Nup107